MRIVLSLFLVLGLIGCRTFWDPTFMPSGYAYNDQPYKSAPGAEARDIGYPYSTEKNAEILQIWRMVAEDLVAQMREQADLEPQEIYVHPLPQQNAFNASYDHVLREVLREQGYDLSSKDSALHLWYEAHVPKGMAEDSVMPDRGEFEEFLLVLSILRDAEPPAGKIAGIYKLPTYGYRSAAESYTGPFSQPIVGGGR